MRSALAAAAVVACAVLVAGVGLLLATRATLTGNLDAAATQRAGQVVAALQADDPTRLAQTLQPAAGDRTAVQVLDSSGRVLDASPDLGTRPALTAARPAPGQTVTQQRLLSPDDEDEFRILATGAQTADGARVVVVGQSLRPVNESLEVIVRAALVGVPALALVVGLATYFFVGKSLRPVEAIRRRVSTITASDLRTRVPVPAARDEVAALAETMNAMLDRLDGAARTQRRFVADASHELRSPLATLQVGLELLEATDSGHGRQLRRMRGETARLSRIISDLLLLARADEHGLTVRHDDVDLDDLAYVERDRLHAEHPELRIESRIRPARVRGDAHQLDRVIRNLCDNAARYARQVVTLTVTVGPDGTDLRVDDDGPGIDEAERERVFDRFVRLDDSRTRSDGGSGLGLAIAHEIVASHGGRITAETSSSGGASLHVWLPPADL
ncbi:sensor histidine kinase [Asanoa iriomotensis]|uniref:sensor histidine kinase n=1 Tax=Asanoa iriomotensis TaxID=234613 RepID=UPI001EF27145|nr:HAMP domain-containing sensor histidine kinase [Asanoa iriomotensis]